MIPFLANAIRMLPGAFKFGPLDDALVGRALAPRLGSVTGGGRTTAREPWGGSQPWYAGLVQRELERGIIEGRTGDLFKKMYTPYQLALAEKNAGIIAARQPIPLPTWQAGQGAFPFGTNVGTGFKPITKLTMEKLAKARTMNPYGIGGLKMGDEAVNKMLAPFNVTANPRNYVDDIALTGTPIGRGAGRAGRVPAVVFNYGEALPPVRLFPASFHAAAPRLSAGMKNTDLRVAPQPFFQFTGPQGMPSAKSEDIQRLVMAENEYLRSLAQTSPVPRWGNMFTSTNPF